RCALEKPADSPDVDFDTADANKTYELKAAAGTIYGFVAKQDVKITVDKPDESVLVITAAGKNPWPVPPPSAPFVYKDDSDYTKRFSNFNTGEPGGRVSRAAIQYLVATPDPAQGTEQGHKYKQSK